MNEYFELTEDEDLQSNKGCDSMILYCPECFALFQMKACGRRTIFPWFGYHPTDGNCLVLKEATKDKIEQHADNCLCEEPTQRITKIKTLIEIININKEIKEEK